MREILYGPFRLVLDGGDVWPPQRVTIAGSANADGVYLLDFDDPLDLSVEGDAWSVDVEFFKEDPVAEWITAVFTRSTAFEREEGLIVELMSGLGDSPSLGEFRPSIRLLCTSLDEETAPPLQPSPYDFTVPETG
jgi:hypothetical protein